MSQHRNETADLRDIRHYLAIVLRHRWLVAAAVILGIAVTLAISMRQTPQYKTEALIVSAPQNLMNSYQRYGSINRIQTEIATINSVAVASLARKKLDDAGSYDNRATVTASAVQNTDVITLAATGTDPRYTAALANATADAFIEHEATSSATRVEALVSELQPSLDAAIAERERLRSMLADIDKAKDAVTLGPDSISTQFGTAAVQAAELKSKIDALRIQTNLESQNYQIIQRAEPPSTPSSPKTRQDVLLGAALGLLLGLGGAFLLAALDDYVRSTNALEEIISAPVMGLIPDFDEKRHGLLTLGRKRRSLRGTPILVGNQTASADAFWRLRTNLQFTRLDQPLKTIGITSAGQNEGKSTTTANLAVSMAQDGQRVIVVMGDLRKPSLHKTFGTTNNCGLSTLLTGKHALDECLRPVQIEGTSTQLWLLPSGPTPPNPAKMLGSQQMRELLVDLASRCDVVIVDLPPVLAVSDAVALAGTLDGLLLVTRDGITKQRNLMRTVQSLTQVGGHIIGGIVNSITRSKGPGYAYNYYNYYSYYEYQDQDRLLAGGMAKSLHGGRHQNGDRLVTLPSGTSGNGDATHHGPSGVAPIETTANTGFAPPGGPVG